MQHLFATGATGATVTYQVPSKKKKKLASTIEKYVQCQQKKVRVEIRGVKGSTKM